MRYYQLAVLALSVLIGSAGAATEAAALDTTILPTGAGLGELVLITHLQGCGCTRESSLEYLDYFRREILSNQKFTEKLQIRVLDYDHNFSEADSLLGLGMSTFLPLIRLIDETGYIQFEHSYEPVDSTLLSAINRLLK